MDWFANIFREATEARSGIVARDDERNGRRFLASTVQGVEKAINLKDPIRGGLALELSGKVAKLSAYTLRLACSNGLISILAEEQEEFEWYREAEFEEALYRRYAEMPEATAEVAELYRHSQRLPADERLWQYVLHALNRLQAGNRWLEYLNRAILEERRLRPSSRHTGRRGMPDTPASQFELINAVTALARDTQEPELSWRMEQLGGELLALAGKSTAVYPLSFA